MADSARVQKVRLNSAGIRDLFRQWASGDGMARGARIAATMNATAPVDSGALSHSHHAEIVQHPSRPVVQIGSDLPYAGEIMVRTGYGARALDAGA